MSIIKGKTNIVAGFGGTKRPLGEVYFSQSSLASDNPGALPGWTGEYYENGKTLFPDLYNFVKAHSELQVTKTQYDSAIATYGECPKYVVDENSGTTTETAYKFSNAEPSRYLNIVKTQTPQAGDILYLVNSLTANEPYDLSTATQETIEAVTYSDAGALTSYTINGATMSVRGTVTAVSIIGTATSGTSLRLPKYARNKRKLVKKEVNGNNWYALYSDGWLEQGARYETNVNIENITFFKPFASVPLVLTSVQSTSRISYNDFGIDIYNLTTTGFTKQDLRAVGMGWGWEAKGYAAGTPMENIKYPWIVSFTAAVPASTVQAAEFTGALSGKANTDLSNCPPNYDYVVDSGVLEDGSWWRRHKSGWLEQGNSSPTGDQSFTLNKTINFPKPFADNTYMLVGPGFYISNAGAQTITRTATGFTTSSVQNLTGCAYWYACGQGAED